MYQRNIRSNIVSALADTPVVLINGARQTGKTTLAADISAMFSAEQVTLDSATVLSAAASDPEAFVGERESLLFIDEVQKAPNLFPAIKLEVDHERSPGRFLLTGSSNILLLPKLAESLSGRMEIITLWPLSQGELHNHEERFIESVFARRLPAYRNIGKTDLISVISRGGFPEAISRLSTRRKSAWYDSYITTILQRDVRDLANIEGLTEMPRLLRLLATRIGGLFNISEFSRVTGIPNTTLKRYVSLLETTFLLQFLPAWTTNLGKRLIKSPKVYLVDSGMAAHLTGYTDKRLEHDPTFTGHLLENFVVTELYKQKTWSDITVDLFHFRTNTGREVDIVLEDRSGRVVGVEVKAAGSVRKKDFSGLQALAEICGEQFVRGIVLYSGKQAIPFGKNFHALPVDSLWQL